MWTFGKLSFQHVDSDVRIIFNGSFPGFVYDTSKILLPSLVEPVFFFAVWDMVVGL